MLCTLRVVNLGVIEEAEVEFGPGLIALTGETGAGKTMVVSAIELLLGAKATPEMIREGAESALISGIFLVDGAETVLAREISRSGRSRSYVDGRLASVGELSEMGEGFVELFGQGLSNSISKPATQLEILDSASAIDARPLRGLVRREKDIKIRLDELETGESSRLQRIDFLNFQVGEIERAEIRDLTEDDQLDERATTLSNSVEIREAVNGAISILSSEREGGARDLLARAGAILEKVSFLEELRIRIQSLVAEVDDVRTELRSALMEVSDDPELLDQTRSRIKVLSDLKKKYGPSLRDVAERLSSMRLELDEISNSSNLIESLREELGKVGAELSEEQTRVRELRREASLALSETLKRRIAELAMPSARFSIEVGEHGDGSPVTFLFSANPGMSPQPMSKIASGGEMSRVMLAICLVANRGASTIVFDEIDAGIGGETALHVGRSLSELGRDRQVVVVTHLPQVAAFADQQVQIKKVSSDSDTKTQVVSVDGDLRVSEIARMLSGQTESIAAVEHAKELLDLAGRGGS